MNGYIWGKQTSGIAYKYAMLATTSSYFLFSPIHHMDTLELYFKTKQSIILVIT